MRGVGWGGWGRGRGLLIDVSEGRKSEVVVVGERLLD
jgi:hypothetical protein